MKNRFCIMKKIIVVHIVKFRIKNKSLYLTKTLDFGFGTQSLRHYYYLKTYKIKSNREKRRKRERKLIREYYI